MSMFSSALASGQLGPLMNQFGLPSEAVDAANKGGEMCNNQHTIFIYKNFKETVYRTICNNYFLVSTHKHYLLCFGV